MEDMMDILMNSVNAMVLKISKIIGQGKKFKINSLGDTWEILQLNEELKNLIEEHNQEGFRPGILTQSEDSDLWNIEVSESRSEIYQLLGMLAETVSELEKNASVKKLQSALNRQLQKIKDLKNEILSISIEYLKKERVFKITLQIDGKPPSVIQENNFSVLMYFIKNSINDIIELEIKALKKEKGLS